MKNDDPARPVPTEIPPEAPPKDPSGVSRRSFIQTMGLSAAASAIDSADGATGSAAVAAPAQDGVPIFGPGPMPLKLRINGKDHALKVDPATTLLEALRADLTMTGTKEVCDRGACGACSVLVDGRLTCSCMMLAADAEGAEVTTIEGIADGDTLDPIQESFIRHDALQCGFCTPGLIMACRALIDETPKPSLDVIKQGLSGNLCRCGTYTNVFNAVLDATGQDPIVDGKGLS